MPELALVLVADNLRYPLHTSMPLPFGHVKAGLHLVYGALDSILVGNYDDSLGWSVE